MNDIVNPTKTAQYFAFENVEDNICDWNFGTFSQFLTSNIL